MRPILRIAGPSPEFRSGSRRRDATKVFRISGQPDLSYRRSVMQTIPIAHGDEPSLQQLRVFDVLLREHSLTYAARELGITQPALSKSLAQLRRYFDDPLF